MVSSSGQLLNLGNVMPSYLSSLPTLAAPYDLVAGTAAIRFQSVTASSVSACGNGAIVLSTDGRVLGWGYNSGTRLGSNRLNQEIGLQELTGVSNVASVLCTSARSFAVRRDGTVWMWPGRVNTTSETVLPVQVVGLSNVVRLSAGPQGDVASRNYPLAIKSDGTVWMMASQATPDSTGTSYTGSAQQLIGLSDITDVACSSHCLALKRDGTVVAWGVGGSGQLGDGRGISSGVAYSDAISRMLNPVTVNVAISGVKAIAAISDGSVAIKQDGTVWSWGSSSRAGQGLFQTLFQPVQLPGLNGALEVTCSSRNHCAVLLESGQVWSWGSNEFGQLGDPAGNTRLLYSSPVQAVGINLR